MDEEDVGRASCDCFRRRRRHKPTDSGWSSISKFHVVECDQGQLRPCRGGSGPLSVPYLAAGRPYRTSGVQKKVSKACIIPQIDLTLSRIELISLI